MILGVYFFEIDKCQFNSRGKGFVNWKPKGIHTYIKAIVVSVCVGFFQSLPVPCKSLCLWRRFWGVGEGRGRWSSGRKIGPGLSVTDLSLPHPPRRAWLTWTSGPITDRRGALCTEFTLVHTYMWTNNNWQIIDNGLKNHLTLVETYSLSVEILSNMVTLAQKKFTKIVQLYEPYWISFVIKWQIFTPNKCYS